MTSTKKKDGGEAGGTKFWLILLMAVYGFWGRFFFLFLWTSTCTISKSLSFRVMQRFLPFVWLFTVTLFLEARLIYSSIIETKKVT